MKTLFTSLLYPKCSNKYTIFEKIVILKKYLNFHIKKKRRIVKLYMKNTFIYISL